MASFGTTAIAGKLWCLNESQMLNAFGIALNQAAGSVQSLHEKSHCYKLNQGFGARNGIVSVALASKSFNGLKDPWLGQYGYFAQFCHTYDTDMLTRGLGKEFYADHVLKQYPSCLYNRPAISAALKLVSEHDIDPTVVDQVTISMFLGGTHQVLTRPFEIGDDPHMDANWSIPYNVANVLLRKSMRLEHVTNEFVLDPAVISLARRVKVIELPSPRTARIDMKVILKDGRGLETSVDDPLQEPAQEPLGIEAVKEKFRDNIAFARKVPRANAEKALKLLENLEQVGDVAGILNLLT